MFKKVATLFVAITAFCCMTFAQDHPNFAGTWKLNTSKSEAGDTAHRVRQM
jgi:hypothetical protein